MTSATARSSVVLIAQRVACSLCAAFIQRVLQQRPEIAVILLLALVEVTPSARLVCTCTVVISDVLVQTLYVLSHAQTTDAVQLLSPPILLLLTGQRQDRVPTCRPHWTGPWRVTFS
jgi:hypothetical protein